MKTEISRNSHQPEKRYSGLYQQQGRMLTDADWNELVDIFKTRLQQLLSATIGTGIPANEGMVQHLVNENDIDDSGTWELGWGKAVVDGLLAELRAESEGLAFALNRQADLPLNDDFSLTDGQYHLYLDVWERTVTSLEDETLRDIALKGADTCSRSQLMTQLKWSPDSIDPLDPLLNPSRGNAQLALAVRDDSVQSTDLCAAQIGNSSNIGNFLFRVEVHQAVFDNSGQLTELTLKWSRENGAEHYSRAYDLPPGFVASSEDSPEANDWCYEGFSDRTEKLQGMHLQSGITAPLFELRNNAEYPLYGDPGAPDYIRRWDGYIQLQYEAGNWTFVAGSDRRQTLDPTLDEGSHGHIALTDAGGGEWHLSMHLELFNLDMQLNESGGASHQFVTGDYWQALVREIDTDDDPETLESQLTLLNGGLPVGIGHHYFYLGQADLSWNDGNIDYNDLTLPADTADTMRQFSFPPLTDIDATHVDYNPERTQIINRWQDVLDDPSIPLPRNVQDAIDRLLQRLESSDIHFDLTATACVTTSYGVATFKTLLTAAMADLLAAESDPDNPDLDTLLAGILCRTDAATLPYNATLQATDWNEVAAVSSPNPATVQTAIDLLINRLNEIRKQIGGSGCSVSVGENGQFATIQQAVVALADQSSINLCLLPGDFIIDAEFSLSFGRSIKITGAGVHASRIELHAPMHFVCRELMLRDVQVQTFDTPGHLDVQANVVDVRHCWIRRNIAANATWVRVFSGVNDDYLTGLNRDVDGNLLVTSAVNVDATAAIDFGNGVIVEPTNGLSDVVVVKFNSAGVAQWAYQFGGEQMDAGLNIVTDNKANITVNGSYRGKMVIADNTLNSGETYQAFVMQLTPDGEPMWAQGFNGDSGSLSDALAANTDTVIMAGYYRGAVIVEDKRILPAQSEAISYLYSGFVTAFNNDGSLRWVHDYRPSADTATDIAWVTAVAAHENGNVLVTGVFLSSDLDLGQGITLSGQSGFATLFVVSADAGGNIIWARVLGITNTSRSDLENPLNLDAYSTGVSFLSEREAVVTGISAVPLTFKSAQGLTLAERGQSEIFTVRLDLDNKGEPLRLFSVNAGAEPLAWVNGRSMMILADHSVVANNTLYRTLNVQGHLSLSMDGNESDYYADSSQPIVLRTDLESGTSELVRGFSGLGSGHTFGIAIADDDYPVVAGDFNSTQNDFGNGEIFSATGRDVFIARLGRFDPAVLSIDALALKSRPAQVSIIDTLIEAADDNISGTVALDIVADANADVRIRNNRINGRVLIGAGSLVGSVTSVPGSATTGEPQDSRMTIEDNLMRQLVSRIPYQNSDDTTPTDCADMDISHNTFAMAYNRFIAVQLVLNHNRMAGSEADLVASAYVDSCICIGNLGTKGQVIQVNQDVNANSQILANQVQVSTTAIN